MSWLRSAVIRAVDVKNLRRSNLSRFRRVADTVVLHVVSGGANLIHDRIGYRTVQSFKHAVKRLEEMSISCRGSERVLLLRRWLVSLKQIDKLNATFNKDKVSDPNKALVDAPITQQNLVTYYDSDHGRDSLNFRDVFLQSQALEGMILSMILEPPSEEEINILLEIFRLCVMGGREVHTAIISSIQDLSRLFSGYHEEVLMKRDELLQYAQSAVKGLKMNAKVARIDVEVSTLKTKLNPTEIDNEPHSDEDADDKLSQPVGVTTIEALKEALAKLRMCSKLESLLLEKKSIRNGDSPETHAQKVDKLKVLLESLDSSTLKAERRISDHRSHKEEALHFRLVKATEVSHIEKELVSEIEVLEKQRDELEVQLKKVNTSLSAAKTRLRNAREERDQFDEASNGILQHLQMKEEELSRSITSFRAEAEVITRCIKFIEDSWGFQSTFARQKEKQVNDELEQCTKRHADYILHNLPAYEQELQNLVTCFKVLIRRLKTHEETAKVVPEDEESIVSSTITRKGLEQEYRDLEEKLETAFNLVESIKQTFSQNEDLPRKDVQKVNEVFEALDRIKEEFESIERPDLQGETGNEVRKQQLSWLKLAPSQSFKKRGAKTNDGYSKGKLIDGHNFLDSEETTPDAEAAHRIGGQMTPEIIDWEFDALDN